MAVRQRARVISTAGYGADVSALSVELADLMSLMRVQESVVTLNALVSGRPQQLVQGNPARWELEIWVSNVNATSGLTGSVGTNNSILASGAGIPASAIGLVGKWNVRQDGIRPMLEWFAVVGPTGAQITFYLIETIAVS